MRLRYRARLSCLLLACGCLGSIVATLLRTLRARDVAGAADRTTDVLPVAWCFRKMSGKNDEKDAVITTVLVCRHGETSWNAEGRLQGSTDIQLSPKGRLQANQMAKALRETQVVAVWTSPLSRARETGKAIASATHAEFNVDERLRERSLGVLEGLTPQEAAAAHPKVWRAWKRQQPFPKGAHAECEREVLSRAEAVLMDLFAMYPGRTVVVVTHGAFMRCFLKKVAGNGSITRLAVGPGRTWRVLADDPSLRLPNPGLKVAGM